MSAPVWPFGADTDGGDGVGQMFFRTAAAALPQLVLGSSTDVALSWAAQGALPSTGYAVLFTIEGSSTLLGKLGYPQVKDGSKTTTGCTVSVPNPGLVTISAAAGVLVAFVVLTQPAT